ncbi:unnamed protein product [Protopolystoma xenopodis]|uniref:Uncharacterized protein n=1 Tax=Protopolystoma xenopodis TaxID=117903 RepID=A0A448XPV3_9PLAT|nr:unnamed protein product [Protopolystoma xenopodis]
MLIETLDRLVVITSLLKEFVYRGGLIYLLTFLVTASSLEIRQSVIQLLARCLADKQVGRRIQALLGQFLPGIFQETLRDTPDIFLQLFDCELIPPP